MRLPNGAAALIDPLKLVGYSLNPEHEDGKHKAQVFQSVLGVKGSDAQSLQTLLDALRQAASDAEAVAGKLDKYGQRYSVDFSFTGPLGSAVVRSAWIVRTGETVPRLVTCYIL